MKRTCIFVVALLMFFTTAVFADPISDLSGLENSTTLNDSGDTYILKEGDHSIISSINISGDEVKNFTINNEASSLILNANNATLFLVNDFTLGNLGGNLEVIGGSVNTVYGLHIYGTLTQEAGTITATGGSGGYAHGLRIFGALIQNGGHIEAVGSSSSSARGIQVGSNLIQKDGSIEAKGGLASEAYGLFVSGTLTQEGGTITAAGGSGINAYGLYVFGNSFAQETGKIEATGGSGAGAYGINISSGKLTQEEGSITATGGSGIQAHGLRVYGNLIQNGGNIEARGSSSSNGRGIQVGSSLTQESGTITAVGGGAKEAYGLFVSGTLTQEGGTITATAGSAGYAHGLYIYGNSLTQKGGNIEAIGSASDTARGIHVNNLIQEELGTITAIGKAGVGIMVQKGANLAGNITIARTGSSASIYINALDTSNKLVLEDTSTLTSMIDLSKDATLASGLIYSARNIGIENGATLKLVLMNTARLNEDNPSLENILFMQTNDSFVISNSYSTPISTITMSYSLDKIEADTQYVLTVTRELTPAEALEKARDEGADVSNSDISFAEAIYNFLTKDENLGHKLNSNLDEIDNSFEIEDALAIIKGLKPANQLDLYLWREVSAKNLMNSQMDLVSLMNSSENFATFIFDKEIEIGSYQRTKVLSYGMNLKNLYKANNFSLGLEFKSLPVSIKNDLTKIQGTYSSIVIAAGYAFNIGSFQPQLALNFGYAYSDISMQREDNLEKIQKAQTSENIISASLTFGNKFRVLDRLSLSAYIGLNYSYAQIADYSEDNLNGMQMGLADHKMHSLKPYIKAIVEYEIGAFIISGDVNCSIETLNNKFAGTITLFDTPLYKDAEVDVNDSRFDFKVGVDGTYKASEVVEVNLGYSFYMHGEYMSHQVDLNLGLNF